MDDAMQQGKRVRGALICAASEWLHACKWTTTDEQPLESLRVKERGIPAGRQQSIVQYAGIHSQSCVARSEGEKNTQIEHIPLIYPIPSNDACTHSKAPPFLTQYLIHADISERRGGYPSSSSRSKIQQKSFLVSKSSLVLSFPPSRLGLLGNLSAY